jgi:hypothetical protein
MSVITRLQTNCTEIMKLLFFSMKILYVLTAYMYPLAKSTLKNEK